METLNIEAVYRADPRMVGAKPMRRDVIYSHGGWEIYSWWGDKNDYADFFTEEAHTDGFCFAPLMANGEWHGADLITGQRWVLTMDNPFGYVDGKTHYTTHIGRCRAYCGTDDMQRLCVYPTDAFGRRSFEKLERDYVLGEGKAVVVPRGGLFCMVKGEASALGVPMKGMHVAIAKTGNVKIECGDGCYGVSTWRAD